MYIGCELVSPIHFKRRYFYRPGIHYIERYKLSQSNGTCKTLLLLKRSKLIFKVSISVITIDDFNAYFPPRNTRQLSG